MRVHLCVAAVVITAGLFLHVSRQDWIVLLFCIVLVIPAEMVNTSVESLANTVRDDLGVTYQRTRDARDVAAGAVLFSAIISAAIGTIVFWPYVFK